MPRVPDAYLSLGRSLLESGVVWDYPSGRAGYLSCKEKIRIWLFVTFIPTGRTWSGTRVGQPQILVPDGDQEQNQAKHPYFFLIVLKIYAY